MADTETTIAADTDTSLALTGVYSGLRIEASGSAGTLAARAGVSARTGYRIATVEDGDGRSHTAVTVEGEEGVADPPTLVVTADYAQQTAIAEVDLDMRYADIPQGTSLEVVCSEPVFDISRQAIAGTGLAGSSGRELGAFAMSIEVRLWMPSPAQILPSSEVTLSLSRIEGGTGKPVKKVLLQKLAINLSN